MNGLNKRLRAFAILFLLFSLIVCVLSCSHPGMPTIKQKPMFDTSALERQVHDLVNRERQKSGVPQLAWDTALSAIARNHSLDMARRTYFSHESPEGQGFSERYAKEGYTCLFSVRREIYQGAENLSQDNLFDSVTYRNGVPDYHWKSQNEIAESVVERWMKSPGHRENILFPHWKSEGIGIAITEDGKVLVTQNFC